MNEPIDLTSHLTIVPAGTRINAPDEKRRVTLQFEREDDAIIFFEAMLHICGLTGMFRE
jgi:hypothetical protein